MTHTDIVFDGPPGPECGRFVEVENELGASISFGTWLQRNDGYWVIRFTPRDAAPELYDALDGLIAKIDQLSALREADVARAALGKFMRGGEPGC